jgi:hypothetical protein
MNREATPVVLALSVLLTLAACAPERPPAAEGDAADAAAPAADATAPPAAMTTPAPLEMEEAEQVTATIESVDLQNRLVALKNAEGEVFTVEVGPAVQNLDRVQAGDKVTVTYYEAVGAQISGGAAAAGTTVDLAAAGAEPGEMPAGAVGQRVSGTVTIVSAKPDGSAVTFYRDDGLMRVLEIERPEAREFVKGLKEGDKVDITYTEAVAVSVEPAA